MCGVTQMNCITDENVQRRTGVVRELVDWAEQGVMQWFRHVERMQDGHLMKVTALM